MNKLKRWKMVGGKNDSGVLQLLAFFFTLTCIKNEYEYPWGHVTVPTSPILQDCGRTPWWEDWRCEDRRFSYIECKWDPSWWVPEEKKHMGWLGAIFLSSSGRWVSILYGLIHQSGETSRETVVHFFQPKHV